MDAELIRAARRGFTLVELVVVVAVLAVLAVGLTLTGGLARGVGPAERAARAFAEAVALAREGALAGGAAAGLHPLRDGWQIVRRPGGGGAWEAVGPPGRLPAPVWEVEGRPFEPAAGPAGAPAIRFLPDGRATPFALRLADGRARLRCATDGWEAPACAPD